jgi:mRNA interferase RelE/StbE
VPPKRCASSRARLASRPLTGQRGWLRIRVGDYHIVYEVHDSELVVLVIQIGHRSEVYDR